MRTSIQILTLVFFFAVNFFLVGTNTASAQASDTGILPEGLKIITGTVMDEQDMPIPGAEVKIRSTNTKVQTDFDGKYSINAKDGDVLVFAYQGMKTQNIKVSKKTKIKVVMREDYREVDSIVYGCCFCTGFHISVASEFMFNY
ncbi:hypothetical protein HYN59_10335 [Flavobacterium album]|uniref:TonB-dependent receptor n=1 Tax=Flavobacterium album TaxID=2175091 RepID=A0A2S1QYK9_9FLAO|nr:carboxypeptidase-like regulatory domain-containing protein [Flavobacterium album]AWH85490.1 hypothetical protein HYN59_10335 [Flavobacterium album]